MRLFDPSLASAHGVELVRGVLDQARNEPLVAEAKLEPTSAELARLTIAHRLGPLVAQRFPSAERRERMIDLTRSQLRLVAAARQVGRWLTGGGIGVRVLKGLATAELDYRTPTLRHTGDVDILVSWTDYDRAHLLLVEQGCEPRVIRATDARLLKGAAFIDPNGVEIDLHFRLSRFFAMPVEECLMADPSSLPHGLSALGNEIRLLHAATHAIDSPNPDRRLSSVADVVALIDNTGIDWERARTLGDQLGLTAIAGATLRAEALIMARDPHPGLDWAPPRSLVRRALATDQRRIVAEHLLALSVLPVESSKAEYLRGWLLPSQETLDYHGGKAAYAKRMLTKLWPRSGSETWGRPGRRPPAG